MLPTDQLALDRMRFVVSGVCWLLVTVGWVASCLWVVQDATRVLGRAMPWKLLFTLAGTAIFLGTLGIGLAAMPTVLLLLPLSLSVSYLIARKRTSPGRQLTPLPDKTAGEIIDWLPLGDRLAAMARWLKARSASVPAASSSTITVELLKKDGSPYDSRDRAAFDHKISAAVKSLEGILWRAIDVGATDVHLEPRADDEMQLRYRVDGVMQSISLLKGGIGKPIVSAIKVLSDMDIAEHRHPQDGTFAVRSRGRKIDVRSASAPTGSFGEKIVLRLLDTSGLKSLDELGMRSSTVKAIQALIQRDNGTLIVCGPTGSGKTTTAYAALKEIDSMTRNVVTIEDPVEYQLPNATQLAVNNATDLTFAKHLRSVLRQDPDVILVGEIRDRETAEIAMQAALTGHFVFTTLHANDTATTITRLMEIGIDATLIQSAVTAVLAQRLVRRLCRSCRQPYTPDAALLRQLGIPPDRGTVFYREREQGCERCNGGYRGRTGVYEFLQVDKKLREVLVGRPSVEAIRAAGAAAGTRTLFQAALHKVLSGETSLAEARRVTA
jgi:type II secretory ATPase GspE/PulE/Tfp pilus assembly ATPase PilB-like protein